MTDVVISSACRTPIGAFQGALSSLSAAELGAIAVKEAVKRAGIDGAKVERAFMGNVLPAAMGQAPARQAVIKAGLPVSVGAVTVNKVCGSGLQAVMFARRDDPDRRRLGRRRGRHGEHDQRALRAAATRAAATGWATARSSTR